MSFREPHDLHKRRWSRNLGLGLVLGIFVALVFGLTLVKVSQNPIQLPNTATQEGGN
ncbi:hypothetical protein [Pseudooceanicola nitratireducens]|jgi:hypothetical protein|uniref:Cytochrome C oxidase assembly protein n=1 Tax=Pseudooceanicola nitratireducens TaxID=517719 RepID=A0A1I1NJY5_9RHOB|nr:hypothetical protein [Pseudooceanicola nitratireducens]MBY6156420.1 hypothetical protein [Pseudooceanicola nitratireducens]MBY6166786.1 hypothetical protein [Pseudooceanicola nitratireducens]SEI73613.1 hypothetical protein SAMN05216183_101499 [Pseudooceanicola nitratireducens]SFC94040.1 hypothetical protein SAMN05421762_2839 [Pseudooceanicola nitratireducens]